MATIKFKKIGDSSVNVVENKCEFANRLVSDVLFKYFENPFNYGNLRKYVMYICYQNQVAEVLVSKSDEGIKVYMNTSDGPMRIYIEDGDMMFTNSSEAVCFIKKQLCLAEIDKRKQELLDELQILETNRTHIENETNSANLDIYAYLLGLVTVDEL